jgi:hypothetical protein
MAASIAAALGDASLISLHPASDSPVVGLDFVTSRPDGLDRRDDAVRVLNRGDDGRSVGFTGRLVMVSDREAKDDWRQNCWCRSGLFQHQIGS